MLLYVMRHGESESNVDRSVYKKKPNFSIELTEKGKEEAEKSAKDILLDISFQPVPLTNKTGQHNPVLVFSSPYQRAKQTAQIVISKFVHSKLMFNMLLGEQNFGLATGHSSVESFILGKPEQENLLFKMGKLATALPQGESMIDVALRAEIFLQRLLNYKRTNYITVVSHLIFCSMFHAQVTGEIEECLNWETGKVRIYKEDEHREWFQFIRKL